MYTQNDKIEKKKNEAAFYDSSLKENEFVSSEEKFSLILN